MTLSGVQRMFKYNRPEVDTSGRRVPIRDMEFRFGPGEWCVVCWCSVASSRRNPAVKSAYENIRGIRFGYFDFLDVSDSSAGDGGSWLQVGFLLQVQNAQRKLATFLTDDTIVSKARGVLERLIKRLDEGDDMGRLSKHKHQVAAFIMCNVAGRVKVSRLCVMGGAVYAHCFRSLGSTLV